MQRDLYKIDDFGAHYKKYIKLPNGEEILHVDLPPIERPSDSNQNIADLLDKQMTDWHNEEFIQQAIIYGQYGWALYDNTVREKFLDPLAIAMRTKSCNQDVDYAISSLFTNYDLFVMQKELTSLFAGDKDSIKKSKVAIRLFRKKRYYESAMILFGLLDSHSIKILKNEQCKNTKQGLRSMSKVLKLKFGHAIGMTLSDGPNQPSAMKELFDKLPEYVSTENINNDFIVYEIINLAYSFKTLFNDCDWESSDILPASINRNYLMHGMYKYDDIERYDCIKIMFLLRKLLQVYSYNIE